MREVTANSLFGENHVNNTNCNHERWIWLELIGFDRDQPDRGVQEYLDTTGFVPDAICLLLSSIDFVLLHGGMAAETELFPDVCSREGHEHNQDRQRQVWTNHGLRDLVSNLQAHGIDVYATVFAQYHGDRHHREWASDHPEVRAPYLSGVKGGVNALRRLEDGAYFEDFFCNQLLRVLTDYGFDGWHGADGYGPLSGPLYEVDLSDDMVEQFVEATGVALPDCVERTCGDDFDKLRERGRWIWRERRHEWIQFWADRWTAFWQKMVEAIHGAGKKAVINSSWGRAPFESLYRYGIDYQKIVATGVDGIIVETVAAGLCMDNRTDCAHPMRHYDFLAMLLLLKAYVPDTKLIFLHNTHDIVEQWDALRHVPTILEKEIYSLANVYVCKPEGALQRAAGGLLACLGDGIRPHEWQWLRDRWALSFEDVPKQCLGATLVWSEAYVHGQVDDFTDTRTWFVHRLLFHLMWHGAMVQSAARVDDLDRVTGAVVCLNPHLLPEEELQRVLAHDAGPVILVGRKPASVPSPAMEFEDLYPPDQLWCGVYGATPDSIPPLAPDGDETIPADLAGIVDERGYWNHLVCRKVSDSFLAACATVIRELSSEVRVLEDAESVDLMVTEHEGGRLRVAVKSNVSHYAQPQVDVGAEIESLEVATEYPMMKVFPEGSRFRVKVPPRGISVVDVRPQL